MSDFLNKYPYTDFHELNLDWVIERVKKLTEDWAATLEEWNSTEEQWQQLYDYVHDYFDNLDVQQEINNKINAMIADGTFVTITTPVIEAKVASMMPGTVADQIGATVASQIGATVASQIGDTVASQIAPVASAAAADWLAANVNPVGSAVTIDKSLSIEESAADAFFTGVATKKSDQNLKYDPMSSVFQHAGFLKADGTYDGINNTFSKTTARIPCKPGDMFYYSGRADYNAKSVLFYEGDAIISSAAYVTSATHKRTIVIPAGIDGVVFSSYSTISYADVYLNVEGAHGYQELFDNNTLPRILTLEENAAGPLTSVKKFIQGSLIDNTFLQFNSVGEIIEVVNNGSACTDFIQVTPGEKVYITAEGQYSAIVYAIYDYDKNILTYYPTSDTGATYTTYSYQELTIPNNGYYIRLSSIRSSSIYLQNFIHRSDENLIDILDADSMTDNWNDIILTNTTNEYLNRLCSPVSFSNAALSDYVEVRPGEILKITGKCADGSRILACYDANKNLLTSYPDQSIAAPSLTWNEELYQIPFGSKYIRVSAVYTTIIGIQRRATAAEIISSIGAYNNYLANKKYIAIGDSFTHGDFSGLPDPYDPDIWDSLTSQYKTYPWQIARRNSMQLTNMAVNGSKLVDFVSNQDYLNIPADADYCTIMYGLNDYSASVPIGTTSDATPSTFCGAWNILLDWINNNRPNLKVGILIISAYLGNSYRTATETMAKKYGIPFLNFYTDDKVPIFMNKSGVDASIAQVKYRYYQVSENNSHPNITCHIFESTFIENFMRGL